MTDETGNPYPFDFFETITGISFPQKKNAFCFVSFHYLTPFLNAPVALEPTLKNLPYGTSWNMFNTVDDGDAFTPIVNPITDAMVKNYRQWSVVPFYQKKTSQVVPGITVFYVTTGPAINAGNWDQPFPGFTQCGAPLTQIGAYGGTVFDCNPTLEGQAAAHGFDPNRILKNVGGNFPSASVASYFADAFNSTDFAQQSGLHLTVGSFTLSGNTTIFQLEGRASFILNTAAIQKKLAKDATSFTFELDVPVYPAGGNTIPMQWQCQAAMNTARDLPVSATNTPAFTPWPQDQVSQDPTLPGGKATIIGTVDIKAKTVKLAKS